MKIDWKKAPKVRGAFLIGHSFHKTHGGWWHYLRTGSDCLIEISEYHTDFDKPKELRWQDSFTPYPRKK